MFSPKTSIRQNHGRQKSLVGLNMSDAVSATSSMTWRLHVCINIYPSPFYTLSGFKLVFYVSKTTKTSMMSAAFFRVSQNTTGLVWMRSLQATPAITKKRRHSTHVRLFGQAANLFENSLMSVIFSILKRKDAKNECLLPAVEKDASMSNMTFKKTKWSAHDNEYSNERDHVRTSSCI